ncbi:BglG family transcription antiterminator [[Eubacterium] hominis]|uniref:BglG family transcription antiterminator n=1 Tax=[Eubacterium] hominis TaxID=2764325 RepID=UPI003A4D29B1
MALNKRQEKIIAMMNDMNDWITGKELSKLLNVSDRTIRSDIDVINRTYENELIESNLRYGYHLNQDVFRTLDIEIEESIPQTPQERCVYIIQELLFQRTELNIIDLQNLVYVSGYSIDNDIKRIKKMVEPYEDLKLVRSKSCIHLEGSESSKRKLYKELLAAETKGNFLNMNKLASLYKDFNLLEVKALLDETIRKYDFHIREMAMPILMMHVGVSMERIIHHNFIETDRKNPELAKSVEYQIAKEFFHKVAGRIRIEVVEDEIVLLALLLLGKRSSEYTGDKIKIEDKDYNVKDLVKQLLDDIYQTFDIDFRKDVDLQVGLQMHMQSMIERQLKQVEVDNVYLQEIKKKYPLVFEMGVRAGKFLEEKTNLDINENELGFIALHLGSAYDRSSASGKYRVLMIYPDDQALSKLCAQKVETRFGERMEIVEHMSLFEEAAVNDIQPDMILTTLPLLHSLDILTVQITLFVNYEDESRIFQALNQLDKVKSRKEFQEMIVHLIKPQFFYTDLDVMTPEEMISYMCDQLIKEGYAPDGFKASVLQRESMSSTSFTYGFAIPHTFNVMANQSCLSVAILKNPITWGDFEVQLVILLAIKNEDRKLLRVFFDWLSSVVSNSSKFASLLETTNHKEFIYQILQS